MKDDVIEACNTLTTNSTPEEIITIAKKMIGLYKEIHNLPVIFSENAIIARNAMNTLMKLFEAKTVLSVGDYLAVEIEKDLILKWCQK